MELNEKRLEELPMLGLTSSFSEVAPVVKLAVTAADTSMAGTAIQFTLSVEA